MTTLRINDNGTDRDMTADEAAAHNEWAEAHNADMAAQQAADAQRAAARASALNKLGLTADEISALFG